MRCIVSVLVVVGVDGGGAGFIVAKTWRWGCGNVEICRWVGK